jgi:hypothetical protein
MPEQFLRDVAGQQRRRGEHDQRDQQQGGDAGRDASRYQAADHCVHLAWYPQSPEDGPRDDRGGLPPSLHAPRSSRPGALRAADLLSPRMRLCLEPDVLGECIAHEAADRNRLQALQLRRMGVDSVMKTGMPMPQLSRSASACRSTAGGASPSPAAYQRPELVDFSFFKPLSFSGIRRRIVSKMSTRARIDRASPAAASSVVRPTVGGTR